MSQTIQKQILDRAAAASEIGKRSRLGYFPPDLMPAWVQEYLEGMTGEQLTIPYKIPTKTLNPTTVKGEFTEIQFGQYFTMYGDNSPNYQTIEPFDTQTARNPSLGICFLIDEEKSQACEQFAIQPELYIGTVLWFSSLFKLAYDIGNNPSHQKPKKISIQNIRDVWRSCRSDLSQAHMYSAALEYQKSLANLSDNLIKDPQQIAGAIVVLAISKQKNPSDALVISEDDINEGMKWFYGKGAFTSPNNGMKCPARHMLYQNAILPLYKGTPNEASALVHSVRQAKWLIENDPIFKLLASIVIKKSTRLAAHYNPRNPRTNSVATVESVAIFG